jgi:Zn-dependent protease with chaperone function
MRGIWAVVVAIAMLLAASTARADAKERRAARDAEIIAQLGALEEAQTAREATKAYEANDYPRTLALYEKVNATQPTFTPALRRRATLLARLGRRDEGLVLARKAVELENTRENRGALAYTLASRGKDKPPSADDANEAIAIARNNANAPDADIDDQYEWCQVALLAWKVEDLQTCSAKLVKVAPLEPEAYFVVEWAALARGDRSAAEKAIEQAQLRGATPDVLAAMQQLYDASEPPLYRWGKRLGILVAVWLAGLLALFGLGNVFSKKTLALTEQMAQSRGEHPEHRSLRGMYRALLSVASFYYYASLPLVLVLSILAGGAVIIAFLYVGHIPLYLFAVTLGIVAYTIKSVIKSLLVRGKDDVDGLLVDLNKHTKLAKVLNEVADRVGTRPVDEVYLTPKAEVAVLERGGLVRQLRGNTERCLILGIGVLEGMKLQPFKAILAHEYGHFSNRDTAGGGVALSVRRSLLHTALGLAQSGAAVVYNPAWLFLVNFHRIFLRISQGASRLQEVMADRIAAQAYGPEAFAAGLKHVVRREFEIDARLQAVLQEAIDERKPLPNVYAFALTKEPPSDEILGKYDKAMDREPTPYDSHPKPVDRIRWVRELVTSLPPAAPNEEDAWSLFADRANVEERITAEVRELLAHKGINVPAA